jgi:hypothetical protein
VIQTKRERESKPEVGIEEKCKERGGGGVETGNDLLVTIEKAIVHFKGADNERGERVKVRIQTELDCICMFSRINGQQMTNRKALQSQVKDIVRTSTSGFVLSHQS